MGAIFGGGQKEARAAAEKARQEQKVANDRQLSQLQVADQKSGATRRNPRGRRLFVADASAKTDLS